MPSANQVVALLVLAAAAAAFPAASHQSPDRRLLAFAAGEGWNSDIYVIRAEGTGLRRLTRSPLREDTPTWSPDGKQLAFRVWSGSRDDEEIYVMNADGSARHDISRDPEAIDRSPAWSPDGRSIAYATGPQDGPGGYLDDIWLMSPDGGGKRALTHRRGIDEYPVWSPDGSQIAFACTDGRILPSRNGDFEICLMRSDGSGVRRATDASGVSLAYSWSPSGRTIAFASNRADPAARLTSGGDLFLLDVASARVTRLTRGAPQDVEPAFSRDGRQIAFASLRRRSRHGDLYLLRLRDRRIRRLTHLAGDEGDPAWQPSLVAVTRVSAAPSCSQRSSCRGCSTSAGRGSCCARAPRTTSRPADPRSSSRTSSPRTDQP
jgi:Tol biopolymer transport system component